MKSFFGKSKSPKMSNRLSWIPLTHQQELDELMANSHSRTQVIFKHSTRCGISRMVIKEFETRNSELSEQIDFFYLDLLNYRSISNDIADRLEVLHQSPQLIVIRNRQVVAHESHGAINSIDLKAYE
jgi:bacillithiol system protein YtxJ